MGTSIPEDPRWKDGDSPAERRLWRWAVEQLDDRILVLPQVVMTVGTGGRAEEAEADLVLIDPDGGVTIVEVKGGTISYHADRAEWRNADGGSRPLSRDPVSQVKRTRSILSAALEGTNVPMNSVAVRWAVAVPDCRLDAPGEPVLGAAQLWDASCSTDLAAVWGRTVGTLVLGEEPLGEARAALFARHLRGRTVDGQQSLTALIDDHEASVRVHTESHRNVLRQFSRHPHVLVRGSAGTGKTMLALEAAAQHASLGSRVLVTCWNVVLARWLRRALAERLRDMGSPEADHVTDDPTGRVVVAHVVGLARAGSTGSMAAETREAKSEYFHEELPFELTPAVTGGPFDVVILDEAQDLTENWVLALSAMVDKQGRWYAFSDRQQDLFAADAALPDFLEVQHELLENFRNSRAIAEVASWFGDIETDCLSGDGPPVRYVAVPSDRVVGRTKDVAKKLIRDQKLDSGDVAVLWLFENPWRGRTDGLADAAEAGELVMTNAASFKGMERPVIVLGLDIDPTKTDRVDDVRRAIYAGITRARSSLVIIADPDVVAACGFDDLAAAMDPSGA